MATKNIYITVILTVFTNLCSGAPVNESVPLNNASNVEANDTRNVYNDSIRYGAILDAGSTSTKVHLYSWEQKDHETTVPNIKEIQYRKYKPGVGSYATRVHDMEGYITPMFDFLEDHVPSTAFNTTPVMFMATAGVRLLPETSAQSILDSVRSLMANSSINPFLYDERFVKILSGEEEGFLAWISVNYLHGYFHSKRSPEESMGIIEVGGGSSQIAFVPDVPIYEDKMPVNIGGQTYEVYTHSHLSYGAQAMTKRITDQLVRENQHAIALVNPCMLRGDKISLQTKHKNMDVIGGGNASECQRVLRHYLSKSPEYLCSPKPCTIGSVYGPPVGQRTFVALGAVYNTAKELGLLQDSIMLKPNVMEDVTKEFCNLTLAQAEQLYGISPKWASSDCQNGLYIPMLLEALGFDSNTTMIETKKKVEGTKIGWGLGAMLQEEERLYKNTDRT